MHHLCFEVDDWNYGERAGWSVLVEGMSDVVSDDDEYEALKSIDLHPWPSRVEKTDWIRILPEAVTGCWSAANEVSRGGYSALGMSSASASKSANQRSASLS